MLKFKIKIKTNKSSSRDIFHLEQELSKGAERDSNYVDAERRNLGQRT
jgi:hypothetical protein